MARLWAAATGLPQSLLLDALLPCSGIAASHGAHVLAPSSARHASTSSAAARARILAAYADRLPDRLHPDDVRYLVKHLGDGPPAFDGPGASGGREATPDCQQCPPGLGRHSHHGSTSRSGSVAKGKSSGGGGASRSHSTSSGTSSSAAGGGSGAAEQPYDHLHNIIFERLRPQPRPANSHSQHHQDHSRPGRHGASHSASQEGDAHRGHSVQGAGGREYGWGEREGRQHEQEEPSQNRRRGRQEREREERDRERQERQEAKQRQREERQRQQEREQEEREREREREREEKKGRGRRGAAWFSRRWPRHYVDYEEYAEFFAEAAAAERPRSGRKKHYERAFDDESDWFSQFWADNRSGTGAGAAGRDHNTHGYTYTYGAGAGGYTDQFTASWWQRFRANGGAAGSAGGGTAGAYTHDHQYSWHRQHQHQQQQHHPSRHPPELRAHMRMLGLEGCGALEVGALKAAFRARAKETHPDLHPAADPAGKAAAEERFKAVQQAYQALSRAVAGAAG